MLSALRKREIGGSRCRNLADRVLDKHLKAVSCSTDRELQSPHANVVTCLDIDRTDCRYLLASGADANISIFDLDIPVGSPPRATIAPLFPQDQWLDGHEYAVTCVQWYPVDTGMFISGALDHTVKLWDTNSLKVVACFALGSRVNAVHMAHTGGAHQLIGAATDDNHIRLCDVVSGGFSHTLMGHTGHVWSLQWSPRADFELASGSADGTVRLWDIRRSGVLAIMDLHNNIAAPRAATRPAKRARVRKEEVNSHMGAVTQVAFTPDGRSILSTGLDQRLRRWVLPDGKNSLVNYHPGRSPHVFRKGTRLAFSQEGRYAYCPVGANITMYEVSTGRVVKDLGAGHFSGITALCMHPSRPELYSASRDASILVWAPPCEPREAKVPAPAAHELAPIGGDQYQDGEDGDDWSDDGPEGAEEDYGQLLFNFA